MKAREAYALRRKKKQYKLDKFKRKQNLKKVQHVECLIPLQVTTSFLRLLLHMYVIFILNDTALSNIVHSFVKSYNCKYLQYFLLFLISINSSFDITIAVCFSLSVRRKTYILETIIAWSNLL